MRLESLVIGGVVLVFGIVLVSTNGVIAGVNLPGVIGLPSCSSSGSSNSSAPSPTCYGLAGFGVGTVVCIFGLGMIANGLRAPASRRSAGAGGSGSVPPELQATLARAQFTMAAAASRNATAGGSSTPGVRYCPECGHANGADAKFCQGCGRTMPPPSTPPTPSQVPPVPFPAGHDKR